MEQVLDPNNSEQLGMNGQIGNVAGDSSRTLTGVTRREWFRTAAGGCAGLALGGLVDVAAVRANTQKLKLSDVSEFTTSCNFCSCGCGMVATVREGKLITMEGDFDHIVNRGSLCVKGISMFATHASPNRLTTPRYRAPGSDHWERRGKRAPLFGGLDITSPRHYRPRSWIETVGYFAVRTVTSPVLLRTTAVTDAWKQVRNGWQRNGERSAIGVHTEQGVNKRIKDSWGHL